MLCFGQEVLMKVHTNPRRCAQLNLFYSRSEATPWYQLPQNVQQAAVTLLARLLHEYSATAQPAAKEAADERED
jgi:hypothetical protein